MCGRVEYLQFLCHIGLHTVCLLRGDVLRPRQMRREEKSSARPRVDSQHNRSRGTELRSDPARPATAMPLLAASLQWSVVQCYAVLDSPRACNSITHPFHHHAPIEQQTDRITEANTVSPAPAENSYSYQPVGPSTTTTSGFRCTLWLQQPQAGFKQPVHLHFVCIHFIF